MTYIYNFLLLLVYWLLRFLSVFHGRLRENFRLRSKLPDFSRSRGRLHIWFHAASAGEFEQARAVAHEFKKKRKDVFLSFSFFSDSAYRARKDDELPDAFFALPFDFSWRMHSLIGDMKPDALLIAKYDAWPNQVREAVKARVPVYLISATLPEKSLRWRFPLNVLLGRTYQRMRRIFSINEAHARRLRLISAQNVEISGDTRYDAIALRLALKPRYAGHIQRLARLLRGSSVLVAGSTYPESEGMLADFLSKQPRIAGKSLRALIAPHHVETERIAGLDRLLQSNGLKVLRWSQYVAGISSPDTARNFDVLIVDTLGVLPYLYPLGNFAYVGGGFQGSVHSVIEPVIAGVPVITGPSISNSAEAEELAELGMLSVVPECDSRLLWDAVENIARRGRKFRADLQSYFRQRVGVSRQIVHTVMDDILSN